MTEATLHIAEAPKKPSLEQELRELMSRVCEMEDVLRGAKGVFHAIHAGGLLDSLPKDKDDHAGHEAATGMLDLLDRQVTVIVDRNEEWDCSFELVRLADKARDGKLLRYGEIIPE